MATMITRLNDIISLIDTMALGQPRVVAAYLVSGKERALVDMGFESSAPRLIKDLADAGVEDGDLDYLLPTHVHMDHAGSCGTLARKFSKASVLVHPKGESHLADPTRLCKGVTELFGVEQMERMGSPKPVSKKQLAAIGDDQTINLGKSVTLRSMWTPGHASHHLSYLIEATSTVLTGDAIGTNYPGFPVLIPTTPPTSFNLPLALNSIERIRQIVPREFLAPHFGVMSRCEELLDANVSALREWRSKIEERIKEGRTAGAIAKELEFVMTERCRLPISSIPDYVTGSISRSVLGFMKYLQAGQIIQN